jgi:hypothetical protein
MILYLNTEFVYQFTTYNLERQLYFLIYAIRNYYKKSNQNIYVPNSCWCS